MTQSVTHIHIWKHHISESSRQGGNKINWEQFNLLEENSPIETLKLKLNINFDPFQFIKKIQTFLLIQFKSLKLCKGFTFEIYWNSSYQDMYRSYNSDITEYIFCWKFDKKESRNDCSSMHDWSCWAQSPHCKDSKEKKLGSFLSCLTKYSSSNFIQ